jgi:disulfide bond formation protein DsbB
MLICAVVFAIAAATIMTAHAFERFGGYAPCPLCLEERYAYYFGVPASFLAFFAARANAIGAARILLLLVALAFLANAAAGVYHSGIEWKWWPGPTACSGGFDLKWGEGGIVDTPIIRCDEAAWRFLMLSFAGWNALISAVLAAVAGWGAQKR